MQVEVLAVNRRLIDLEVAGVDDGADGRRDGERHAVRHAVRDPDELDGEWADGHGLARFDGLQSVACVDAVLFELRLDERQRHRRPVDRAVEVRQHVRHRADVILVAVGEDERLDLASSRLEVREVGDDQVDAELIGIRKHDARVNEDRGVLPGHRHHVHAELAEPAQRDDLERGRRHDREIRLIHSDPRERRHLSTVSAARAGDDTGCRTRQRRVGRQAAGNACISGGLNDFRRKL